MRIEAALVREQGVTFAVLAVKPDVLRSPTRRDETSTGFAALWPGKPVILMAQDSRGVPEYYGRRDIVRFLATVPMETLPWRSWSVL
jgi:hypothetical protein